MRYDYPSGRPLPPGLILEDYTEDVEIGRLKSGKEADVFVVERYGRDHTCLLAAKRYRPAEHRAFKNDAAYRAHRRIDGFVRDTDGRRRPKQGRSLQLAMDKKTAYGKQKIHERWIQAEFDTLTLAWEAGAPVPYPVERLSDGLLMEFVGDHESAAPRLVDVRPTGAELTDLYGQTTEALRGFVRAGLVHADLSPYNMLVWEGRVWVIDMPQSVTLLENSDAMDFMRRDVDNVAAWFIRRGLDIDPEDLFVTLANDAFDLSMKDMFRAQ